MNQNCINELLYKYETRDKTASSIVFDFSETTWCDASVTPLLGVIIGNALIDYPGQVYVSKIPNKKVSNILEKNGFLNTYGLAEKTPDTYGTTIPYTVLDCNDDEKIDDFLDKEVFGFLRNHIEAAEIEIIRNSINEVSHNVKDHSSKSKLFFCGQFYPKKGYISLTMTDDGITIPTKIKQKFSLMTDKLDCHLIEWATGKGNSTKSIASSGLGLFGIRNYISEIGEFTILSGNGYWYQSRIGEQTLYELSYRYSGTLLNMKFYTDNQKSSGITAKDDIMNPTSLLF